MISVHLLASPARMTIGNNSLIPQSAPVRGSFIRGIQDGKCLINKFRLLKVVSEQE